MKSLIWIAISILTLVGCSKVPETRDEMKDHRNDKLPNISSPQVPAIHIDRSLINNDVEIYGVYTGSIMSLDGVWGGTGLLILSGYDHGASEPLSISRSGDRMIDDTSVTMHTSTGSIILGPRNQHNRTLNILFSDTLTLPIDTNLPRLINALNKLWQLDTIQPHYRRHDGYAIEFIYPLTNQILSGVMTTDIISFSGENISGSMSDLSLNWEMDNARIGIERGRNRVIHYEHYSQFVICNIDTNRLDGLCQFAPPAGDEFRGDTPLELQWSATILP